MRLSLLAVAVGLALAGSLPDSAHAAKPKKARKAAAAVAAAAVPAAAVADAITQLPRGVRPTHYDVTIMPDAGSLAFAGKAVVHLDVERPTASITLHALDMTFKEVSLADAQGRILGVPQVSLNEEEQTATFSFARTLPKGSYRLSMTYTGKIGTQAAGLFAVDYPSGEGKKRALYTQFENSDARRMVPSWDEPAFKTSFSLEALVGKGETAVSNMPVERSTELPDGRTLVRFAKTPRMSTYLLFLGVGEFERATTMVDGVELGVVTKKGAASQAAFVLESSKAVLREYNDFFGVKYPLPKLDNVAAPGRSQFFSAMENWGAIFSFEYSILLDPAISTQADKQRAFQVAAHEIAHQWFGNLVTMRWWDDLWLNEGFATWMEGRTTERLHPEWNTVLSNVNGREAAMSHDALATTHPVVQRIETVEQASQAFDDITYAKGQAVIRMLENYVGENAWRDGVRRYMKQHAYGNTASDDLWRAVEQAAKKPVTKIAHDFTLQPGVPLIRVESACVKNGTTLTLTQGEFSKDRPEKAPLRWSVPVIVQPLGGAKTAALVEGTTTLKLKGCAPVVVNAGQAGYYRTVYQPAHFAALAKHYSAMKPIDQLGLLADNWSLALAGYVTPANFLDLARATPLDADPQIWGQVAGVFAAIDSFYGRDHLRRAAFRQYATARLAPVMARVGWQSRPGEADTVGILRGQLISTLGALGDETVIGEARRRFAAAATDPSAMPAELRRVIMGVVARHADDETWGRIHAAAVSEKTPLIRDGLYDLLASAERENLAKAALALALTDEPGETNSAAMINTVARLHPELAFDFALANINLVKTKVDASSLSRYFPGIASQSSEPSMIGKITAYATAYLAPAARREAENAAAAIAFKVKVKKERLPAIDAWLSRNR